MKIVSYNLNGIRAAAKKGLVEWLHQADVDIFCFQETRADLEQIQEILQPLTGYYAYQSIADKKGYSGTLILTKQEPVAQRNEWFPSFLSDHEGRLVVLEFDTFVLVNLYVPHGALRLDFKMDFLTRFLRDYNRLKTKTDKPVVICTDFNVAHTELDLSNPEQCAGISGYLPIERAMFDRYLETATLFDSYRLLHPTQPVFTWSSYRSKLANNSWGWRYRFDYIFVSSELIKNVVNADVMLDKVYSDHYPVFVTLHE